MSVNRITPWALLALLAATAAGCDGAASARATGETGDRSVARDSAESSARVTGTSDADKTQAGDSERILETTFDDLRFPMEKTDAFAESMLTDKVTSRFDRQIRIRGYMFPTNRKRGIKQFVLVRDNMECCFGPGAALFDCVLVTMRGDATAEFSTYPISVEGEFRFEPMPGRDGRPLAIYQMAGDAVE